MKPFVSFKAGSLLFDCGWFKGEEFALISVNILHLQDNSGGEIDFIEIFGLKIFRFVFAFGWSK